MKKIIALWKTILYFGIMLINDTYYRLQMKIQPDGSQKPVLTRINRAQVYEDYNKKARKKIKRFSGFGTYPQNIDYKQSVGGYYNRYAPPSVAPEQGNWDTIRSFLGHIFGEQYLLALDYLHLLYVKPLVRLPVLVLISRQRRTGKTTFLHLLEAWFGDNMAYVDNSSWASKFTSDWAGKLIVAIDEALLQRRQDSERIKSLATSSTAPFEAKGKDREAVRNFSHFILCSNNVADPVMIDAEEDRYWVVEVASIRNEDEGILQKMIEELPAFAWYLAKEHQLTHPTSKSRLWFSPAEYETEALRRIKGATTRPDQQIIAEVLLRAMEQIGVSEISVILTDLIHLLRIYGFDRINPKPVISAWGAEVYHAEDNLSYDNYVGKDDLLESPEKAKGRFYTFTKDNLLKHI